jgi:hypothetical protein
MCKCTYVIRIRSASSNLVMGHWFLTRLIPLELWKKNRNFQFSLSNFCLDACIGLNCTYRYVIGMRRSSSNLVMVHWFRQSYPSWNYIKYEIFSFHSLTFISLKIAGVIIFYSYPPWNWKRLNMALKLWPSAGAFVALTTHRVCRIDVKEAFLFR